MCERDRRRAGVAPVRTAGEAALGPVPADARLTRDWLDETEPERCTPLVSSWGRPRSGVEPDMGTRIACAESERDGSGRRGCDVGCWSTRDPLGEADAVAAAAAAAVPDDGRAGPSSAMGVRDGGCGGRGCSSKPPPVALGSGCAMAVGGWGGGGGWWLFVVRCVCFFALSMSVEG